jgi:hypothetical protein
MSEVTTIKSVDPSTLEWLSGMKTKYSIEDLRAGNGNPLEKGVLGWSNMLTSGIKKNVRSTKSEATKALLQSVVALPIFSKRNSLISQIQAEDYIEFLEKGVSGTKVKRNTPFKFKNTFVGAKMLASFQVYVASKPIRLQPKRGQSKKDMNKQVAFAMAKSVKMKGIKARNIYGTFLKKNSPQIKELKDIVGRNIGGAVAAEIVTAWGNK